MTRRIGVLTCSVLLLAQSALAELSSEQWAAPLRYNAWHVADGELHFILVMTSEERHAWVQYFWRMQKILAQHDLAHGYFLWPASDSRRRDWLELRDIDVEHQTLICYSTVPLHVSALALLQTLGCLWSGA
jgi:hypothetical protein